MAQHLIIQHLSVQYAASETRVLTSFALDVPAGSCCAILGPTGAGKSTLLQCLAGTMRRHHPESVATGSIQIGETQFDRLPEQILFPMTGLVLQDPYVQISGVRDTVYDEILFTIENLPTRVDDPQKEIDLLLQRLGIAHLASRKPTSLSGGETQRVAVATIMIARPDILLLDEPTTALDTNAQDKLRVILHSLRGKTSVILTDTQIDFAIAVADQIVVLDRGRTVFRGTPMEFMATLSSFSSILPVEQWLGATEYFTSAEASITHGQLISRTLGLQ